MSGYQDSRWAQVSVSESPDQPVTGAEASWARRRRRAARRPGQGHPAGVLAGSFARVCQWCMPVSLWRGVPYCLRGWPGGWYIWILARYDIVRQTYDVVLNVVRTISYVRCYVEHTTSYICQHRRLDVRYRRFHKMHVVYDVVCSQKPTTL